MKKISKHIGNIAYITLCLFTMFMLLVTCMMFVSCQAQTPSNKVSDYGKSLIMFEFSNVNDAHYVKDDANFYLEYEDADAFDYDNLAYMTGRDKWYGDYIAVDIQDSLVSQFLLDWGNYAELRKDYRSNWEEMDKLSYSWGIQEIWIEGDVRYELVYLGRNFNWYE